MAVKYHLVLRKNMSRTVEAGKEKLYYAQTRATRVCGFEELCDLIADSSTASSGDVKLVIDRMNRFMVKSLERGEVVQFGELGNFQLLVSSSGSQTTDAFSSAMLHRPRLCFRPGSMLRNLLQTSKGERFTPEPAKPSEGGNTGGDENPDDL